MKATQEKKTLSQLLDDLVQDENFSFTYGLVATTLPPYTSPARYHAVVHFKFRHKTMKTYFHMGRERDITAQDVLGSIIDDCRERRIYTNFYEWLGEMGATERVEEYRNYWHVQALNRTALINLLGRGMYVKLLNAEFDM